MFHMKEGSRKIEYEKALDRKWLRENPSQANGGGTGSANRATIHTGT